VFVIAVDSVYLPTAHNNMSNAIGLFLRQVVLQRGIPFDVKLQQNKPLSLGNLSEENFNLEIEKGLADLSDGRVDSADRGVLRKRYAGITMYEYMASSLLGAGRARFALYLRIYRYFFACT